MKQGIHEVPQKVMALLVHGIAMKVDAYDDLPAIIRACSDWARDPWVPHGRREKLVAMLDSATKLLAEVRSGL